MKAFTISETLIVMAIIAILSVISFPFFNSAKDQLSVQRSASQLAQDIRFTMEKAISIEKYDCSSGSETYQYGVYFDTNDPDSYIIFADCNNNSEFDSSTDEVINKIDFESKVKIDSLSYGNTTENSFSIVFIPPDPKVMFDGVEGNNDSFSVNIELGNFSKTVLVNGIGLIDIN